jgi:phosphoribosylformylglycinamidine cyclo-ligase
VNELDLSGTALGWFPKGEAITGENLESGDVLIGLPSSGIHSNGYTLVRAVLQRSGLTLKDVVPFNPNHEGRVIERFPEHNEDILLGEVFLNPTKIYVDPIIDLILSCREKRGPCKFSELKALAHITGGGLSNLLRLHDTLGWHISNPLPIHPEFDWIAKVGIINNREMHRTFNMGMGMVLAVSSENADKIVEWLDERLPGTKIVGSVNNDGRKVTHNDRSVIFEHY